MKEFFKGLWFIITLPFDKEFWKELFNDEELFVNLFTCGCGCIYMIVHLIFWSGVIYLTYLAIGTFNDYKIKSKKN